MVQYLLTHFNLLWKINSSKNDQNLLRHYFIEGSDDSVFPGFTILTSNKGGQAWFATSWKYQEMLLPEDIKHLIRDDLKLITQF